MRRLLTLVFLAAVAVPAAAQETPKPPRAPRAPRVYRDSTGERYFRYQLGPQGIVYQMGRYGRLGVVVDLSVDPARDSVGARIAAVTPGGAADKAGVRTGDLVVAMNGTRLAGSDSADRDEEDRSRPGRRLVELASRLHTGDTVRLELRRENRPLNVTLVAGSSGMEDMVRAFVRDRRPQVEGFSFEGRRMPLIFSGSPLANIELVKMNPGLGEYFGTSEGVLVVSAPEDSALGLRAGDVIQSIGGRKPGDPSHAFRILGTYDAGETVSFEVMRMKRRITVSGKMPNQGGWRTHYNSFDFDVPAPDWGQPDIRGWPGWDSLRTLPDLQQFLKSFPAPMIKLEPRHKAVAT